jgi:hypothetical protein
MTGLPSIQDLLAIPPAQIDYDFAMHGPSAPPKPTHRCAKCGMEVQSDSRAPILTTITACPEGECCVLRLIELTDPSLLSAEEA